MKEVLAVALDVDGVLTDGTVWWGTGGEEFKRFCFADVTGVGLARNAGVALALISAETSPGGMGLVERFAQKVGIHHVYKGRRDKDQALREFAAAEHLELAQICFMGDDVTDLPAMRLAGWSAAPANAHPSVLKEVSMVMKQNGGQGAVRELLDLLIAERADGSSPFKDGGRK